MGIGWWHGGCCDVWQDSSVFSEASTLRRSPRSPCGPLLSFFFGRVIVDHFDVEVEWIVHERVHHEESRDAVISWWIMRVAVLPILNGALLSEKARQHYTIDMLMMLHRGAEWRSGALFFKPSFLWVFRFSQNPVWLGFFTAIKITENQFLHAKKYFVEFISLGQSNHLYE